MFKQISLFLILVLFLVNSCCNKPRCKCKEEWGTKVDDCTPKHFGPFPLGEAKDFLYFKKGSWWVYRNNLSGELDSIYTVTCDTGVVNTKGLDLRWQTLTYTTISTNLRSDVFDVNYIYFEEFSKTPDIKDYKYFLFMKRKDVRPTIVHGPYNVFCLPTSFSPNFIESIPTLNIQGKNYPDVLVFQNSPDHSVQLPKKYSSPITYSGPCKYYWSKGYGLVQIESQVYQFDIMMNKWQKWELIRYNLIK